MATLTPPRTGIPIASVIVAKVEYDVVINPEWLRYLTFGLFDRAGGYTGVSTTELTEAAFEDAGVEEAKAGLYRLEQDTSQSPIFMPEAQDRDWMLSPIAGSAAQENIITLEALISDLREQVVALRVEVEALRQGTLV